MDLMGGVRIGGGAALVTYVVYQRDYFVGGNTYEQTWAVPTAGGTPIQVTTRTADGDQDVSPCVSPDGRKVAYVSGTSFGSYTLKLCNIDGSGAVTLDASTGCASPFWHPDGSKILYRRSNGFRTVEPDGSNNTAITISPAPTAGYTLRAAVYNMDGTLISFSVDDSNAGVANTLWVMNADGSSAGSISTTENTGATISSWSPVADRVAFTKTITGTLTLVATDPDGTNQTTLKSGIGGGIYRSAWTNDGTAVIHTHNSPSSGSIYSADATGGGDTALSPALRQLSSGITGPAVFANGRVYTVRNSTADLVSVLPDGSDLRVEDTPDLVGPDFLSLRLLDAGGTYI